MASLEYLKIKVFKCWIPRLVARKSAIDKIHNSSVFENLISISLNLERFDITRKAQHASAKTFDKAVRRFSAFFSFQTRLTQLTIKFIISSRWSITNWRVLFRILKNTQQQITLS